MQLLTDFITINGMVAELIYTRLSSQNIIMCPLLSLPKLDSIRIAVIPIKHLSSWIQAVENRQMIITSCIHLLKSILVLFSTLIFIKTWLKRMNKHPSWSRRPRCFVYIVVVVIKGDYFNEMQGWRKMGIRDDFLQGLKFPKVIFTSLF